MAEIGSALPAHVRVAVLGAGLAGICMGIQLKRAGIHDFVLLEKADAVGGTWRENTYPGIACDVPSHVYSFSFELNPNWSHAFSPGAEIRTYAEHCASKYGLLPHIRFGVEVTSAEFDGTRWQVGTRGGRSTTADVVVSALGGLHVPNAAQLPGLQTFDGKRFHTARWDHTHELRGKRIGIIGTGASAAQVLPEIAPLAEQVTVFQRHAAWVFPRMAREISDETRATYRAQPWRMRLHRRMVWALMDLMGVLSLRRNSWFNKRLAQSARSYLDSAVQDPDTRHALTPDYTAGCKRRVISDDYLQSFNRPNVRLVTQPIEAVEANGVRDASGELHAIDTLIEATGFKPFNITDYVEIVGRAGVRLADAWRDRVRSLRTMMMPGFPNFFLLVGPNSGTGHTSILIMAESQVQFVIRCLALMQRDGAKLLEPKPEATLRFTERLQRDMGRMVFSGGCGAWYTTKDNYNYTLWPYSALRFMFELARPLRKELQLD